MHERDYRSGLNAAKKAGIEQGIAQGIAQGERKKAVETARILKMSGVEVPLIAKSTGLAIEDIVQL